MIHRLRSLVATGAPGASRLLVFFLIEHLHGVEALGRFSSDIFLAGLLAFFSAIGWAGLVMVRVPVVHGARRDQVVLGLLLRSFAVSLAAGFVIALLGSAGYVSAPGGTVLWLFSWGLYQFARHDLFARQQPGRIVIGEALCLVTTLAVIWLDRVSPYVALSLPFVGWGFVWMAGCLWRMRLAGYCRFSASRRTWPNAMMMGINNLLSGGLGMSVVPIARFVAGDAYAGFLGLLFSTLNILLLFPRTMGLIWLPRLAVSLKRKAWSELDGSLGRFRRDVIAVVLGVGLLASALWYGRSWFGFSEIGDLPWANPIFLLVMSYFVLSQLSLPDASLLMALEKVRQQSVGAVLNLTVYTLFLLIAMLGGSEGAKAVAIVVVGLCCGSVVRNFYLYSLGRGLRAQGSAC